MTMQMMIRAFRDLPMHVFFVCAQQYTQDETKKMHYTPALTGKLAAQAQGFVDIVGFLRAQAPDDQGNASAAPIRPTDRTVRRQESEGQLQGGLF